MDANEICKEQMKFYLIYFSILLTNHKNFEKRFGYASIMELASMCCANWSLLICFVLTRLHSLVLS
jgi:hypothetical protein